MDATSELHDAYGIFAPMLAINFIKKYIDASPQKCRAWHQLYANGYWLNPIKEYEPIYGVSNINKFSKYLTKTMGTVYVKMLAAMEKMPCSYHEIYDCVLKPRGMPFGNDTLLFRSLEQNGLIEFDHYEKYKRKFFRLTALGKLVLETAKANHSAYRVLRHFLKFEGDFDVHMITLETNFETMDDVTPSAFTAMLDALFDEKSKIHDVGSHYYWCNKLVECLKKKPDFFNLFNCQDVHAWLEAHASDAAVGKFKQLYSKIAKKHARNAAKSLAT